MNKFLVSGVLVLCQLLATANDWKKLSILNDQVMVVYFDDGYIEHSGYRQGSSASVTNNFPLDIEQAVLPGSYVISSTDDPDFIGGVHPISISRKSKIKDVSNDCIWINQACDNEHILEHYIYLELPYKIKSGMSYVVDVGTLAQNYSTDTLRFDFTKIRSEAVHVNHVGFIPDAPVKYGYVSHWMGDGGPLDPDEYEGATFHLVDQSNGQSVFQGIINKRLEIATATQLDLPRTPDQGFISMADVWECDFSSFSIPGEYVLAIEGIGASYPFHIHQEVYREAYYHATRQLYHQRSGIPLEKEHTDWTRPRNLHPDDRQIRFQYTTSRWLDWPNNAQENGIKEEVYAQVLPDFKIETWGWYMDAGDWDGYYNHLKIPRLLMTAFELAPQNFLDGELNIPESGNGIPDILDEARFLIDYLDRTRGPSGGIAGGRIHPDFESKIFDNIPSWEDIRVWTISGEDYVTTYTFAGLAAHLAYCYGMLGLDALKEEMTVKALDAYAWASANSNPPADNLRNSRLYASALLFKLTGNTEYQSQYMADRQNPSTIRYANDNLDFGLWGYITTQNENTNPTLRQSSIDQAALKARTEYVETAEARSFRVGFGWNFRTFLGQATTPLIFSALVLHHVTGDMDFYKAALTSSDYVMGGNPLDMNWMVGLGHRSPEQILHLDTWLHPDGRKQFIPGTIPYGPTAPGEGWPANNGPWSSDFAWDRIYPEKDQWPLHEGWFDNRYCVPTNEYTVHQTSAPAAAVFGLLSGTASGNFQPNKAPVVTLSIPSEIAEGQDVMLHAEASDPDGYVIKVEFYNGWRKIGEKTEAPYDLFWTNIPEGPYQIYAIATDNKGKKSVLETFVDIPMESFTLSEDQVEIDEGRVKRIFFEIVPETTTIKSLVWSSDDETIARVDQFGIIQGMAPGNTQIRVRGYVNPEIMSIVDVKVNRVVLGMETKKEDIRFFPNPVVGGVLNLELPDTLPEADYKIIGLDGKELIRGRIEHTHQSVALDLKFLKSGLYLLILESKQQNFQFKIMVD